MEILKRDHETAFEPDKQTKTESSLIRVDKETYQRLKVMSGKMTVAGFLRAFTQGIVDISSLPGYETPDSDRLKRIEHIIEDIDTRSHIMFEKIVKLVDKDSDASEPDKQ